MPPSTPTPPPSSPTPPPTPPPAPASVSSSPLQLPLTAQNQWLVGGAVALVILAGAGWFGYAWYQGQLRAKFNMTNDQGIDLLVSGKSTESIPVLQNAIMTAPDFGRKATAQINLGVAYLQQLNTRAEGAKLLKTVADNQSYPGAQRAIATALLMDHLAITRDVEFAKTNVFIGNWDELFNRNSTNQQTALLYAINAGHTVALAYGSTFHSNYWLGGGYASGALTNTTQSVRQERANKATEMLEAGNIALASAELSDTWTPVQISRGYVLRARLVRDLYIAAQADKTLAITTTEKDVRDAYTKLVAHETENNTKDPWNEGNIASYKIEYAMFLSNHVKPVPVADIVALVSEVKGVTIDPSRPSSLAWAKNLGNQSLYGSDPLRKELIGVAKIDPSFKDFLINTVGGWDSADFVQ